MRVLVLEDHPERATACWRLLAQHGHPVCFARDAQTALEFCDASTYDVLLADVASAGPPGWELMKTLLLRGTMRGIAISGDGSAAAVQMTFHAGFSEHLIKPVQVRNVLAAIERIAALPPRALPDSDASNPLFDCCSCNSLVGLERKFSERSFSNSSRRRWGSTGFEMWSS